MTERTVAEIETWLEVNKYTGPRRGDEIEAWIKRARDRFAGDSDRWYEGAWCALDDLLDDYRLHADAFTSLDVHVSELQQPLVERMEPIAS